MNEEWKKLYDIAMKVLNPHEISNHMYAGSVAAAVLTKSKTIVVLWECVQKEMHYQRCLLIMSKMLLRFYR